MNDADLIASVRSMRKLVVTLDSIGFPIRELNKDEEIFKLIPENMSDNIKNIASDIHSTLQDIEKSKRYKEAVYKLCNIRIRK